MIVRNDQAGWRIVFHSAHALLAGRLASELLPPELPFWYETCTAIGMHDDHKKPFKAQANHYLTEVGTPLDFSMQSMNDETRLSESIYRIAEGIRKHRWIGLLVSKHTDFLYCNEATSKEMKRFLRSEARRRDSVLKSLGVDPQQLEESYQWMRWCDRCSLILCGDDVPAMSRKLEITWLPGSGRVDIWRDPTQRLHIEPWVFASSEIEFEVEQRIIQELSFKDDAQLWEALTGCAPQLSKFHFQSEPAEA